MDKNNLTRILQCAVIGTVIAMGVVGCASTRTESSTGQLVDDSVITTKLKAKLLEDTTVSGRAISVETFKGVVQLSGFANSAAEKARAEQLARQTKGVKSVKNDIVVK